MANAYIIRGKLSPPSKTVENNVMLERLLGGANIKVINSVMSNEPASLADADFVVLSSDWYHDHNAAAELDHAIKLGLGIKHENTLWGTP